MNGEKREFKWYLMKDEKKTQMAKIGDVNFFCTNENTDLWVLCKLTLARSSGPVYPNFSSPEVSLENYNSL